MLAPDLEAALNEQLTKETASAYLYLAMSAHFEHAGYPGFAAWMRAQAEEEHLHAMKFFDHINDRDGRVHLDAIEAPRAEFGAPLEVFEASLEHERAITTAIERLYEGSDRLTQAFLDWFLTEQIEEEKTVGQIVDTLRLAGDSGPSLLLLDRELGSRGPAADAGT